MSWGPFAPRLDWPERKTRFRCLRLAVKLTTGARGHETVVAILRAEISADDPDLVAEAEVAFERLAPLDRRRALSADQAVALMPWKAAISARWRPSCRRDGQRPIFHPMPASARLIASFAALVVLPASAAEITATKALDGSVVVRISGPIVRSDIDKAWNAIEAAGPRPLVILDSPGGDLTAGMSIARAVAKAKARSTVPAGKMCASVCFLAWAAGSDRKAEPGARIGVHTAAEDKIESDKAASYTVDMARSANGYGAPASVVAAMVTTVNGSMYWLSPDEIRTMTGPRREP